MSLLCEKEGIVKRECKEYETTDFEFVSGLRRGGQLLYMLEEKQLYVFKVAWYEKRNCNRRVKKYICYEKGCKASVAYVEDENVCKRNKNAHSHESTQEERRKNFDFINACKNAAANALADQSLQDIYNNTLNNNLIEKPTLSYAKIKRTLYRLRKDASISKRSYSGDYKPLKPAKIAKRSTEDFQHVTIPDSLDVQSNASTGQNTLQDTLALKPDEDDYSRDNLEAMPMEQSYDTPSPGNQHESNSTVNDNYLDELCQPMFEENVLDDKTHMASILQNILDVQKKRLLIDERRIKIEERRLAIDERRLAIEERRFTLEQQYKM